ncbi:MAG: DNA polymerase III subunit alpha [Phycisphaerae bacterium]|nr:DNA polymerase III subunit alpha [Phycisphaerae bacterium]NIP55983.1 DNA polymerase III subunit alpha [Phycisphaerae bacterium]NIS54548.1 DNA polymerase III subunit alpha [Phycisphaerae bacterium]NIU12184.1 DNA polymerase III subunit alpha [Phycisphaerae bacterium]NIU58251.1 DNA polymerase III subunit alpha [Phycisphaerae bacterium]
MSSKGFTHLHLHSQYSLLDGAIAFDKLLRNCKKLQMDTIAVTDHGNIFGAIEFYTKAVAAHIKPILGIEAYIAPGSRFDKQKTSISDAAYHLILLAENNTGYQNLLKLASIGFTEGFYYRPRIDKEILTELNEGLIATSACLKGEIAAQLSRDDEKAAFAAAEGYLKIFGSDRFFIEIQTHENDDPNVRRALIDLAERMGLPLVATNDVHFLEEDDHEAHNCLCAISTGKNADDPSRMIYPSDVYLKTPEQMQQLFSDVPQACENTLVVADRCNVELDLKRRHAPQFRPSDGSTPEEFLTRLCYEAAEQRYGRITEQIKERLDRELDVIESKGFASYFLIVWDFCRYAHENNIPVGARGSAVGTLVGYCLGLCNVDPIRYDLLFERFMDPQRNEMPDVDIDICQAHRQRIIDYVRQKYGHVAQIITFGTMKARAVIRDVCRVLAVPLHEADRLAKLVPFSLDMTLDKALKTEPQLKQAYEKDEQIRKVIDICKKLEGLTRHASVHAAGVVIADEPLTNFVPLYKASDADDIVTQYEGPIVEKVGLLKMDFLGLKTLSVLERACQLVKDIHGQEIDLEKLEPTDAKVFQLFSSGKTKGIFQFESDGMQNLLMRMKPDRIEDLIAANALYRPGPMILIPDYTDRKHGAKWSLPHPIMTEILDETYGIMVYQEQVMRICNRLGDIPLREAYGLIKAISKKKAKTIAKERERFVAGCVDKGLTGQQAKQIFELIERFAGYGFNKSHSTRYAFIAYQTAYMKTHWPKEFMAALLTFEMDNTDKVVEYIAECAEMGIEVLAPDINESGVDFTPLYENADTDEDKKGVLRFGLAAVKGVGEKAVEQIIAARNKIGRFQSLFHFCENVDLRAANKQVIEALIKAGAFDGLGGNRAQMMAGLEKAMQIGANFQADKQNGQMNFFGQMTGDSDYSQDHQSLPDVPPWPEMQMLAFEKQVLGFYVTSNPLSHHAETINLYSTHNSSKLAEANQGRQIVIGGMITKVRYTLTKTGRNAGSKMAYFTLEDLQGQSDVVMFPDILNKFGDLVVSDRIVFVKGKLDYRREKPNILAVELIDLENVREKLAAKIRIRLDAKDVTREKVASIKSICSHHRGKSPVYVAIKTDKGRVYAAADRQLSVNPDNDFCRKMRQLVGPENFQLAK